MADKIGRELLARTLYKSRMGLPDSHAADDFALYAKNPRGYSYRHINVFAAYRDADAILALPALSDLSAERERMREALEWYGEQSRLCRLIHSEGDPGRRALSDDGGKRARSALTAPNAAMNASIRGAE